ncbi:formate hydrogenlyase complex iron-sulfur subunit [Campylobacter geochelonis]|uniref:Formate hydrogenlyase complex iron-sulfur subunit n=1 Tax=Campylobacter geochelonis TaxID=1780362 RepID=A0A128ECI1_9BACT|nr:formate hydrogenlyase complex iron-sulfur subunit [Campylobacter geochelonis]QKF72141.1 hydrogenase-4, iron-sulfur protein [Campylobacter geochelonis]CZE45978.1 formate hydrogenlyase complex iron-sulfur subunit [Campylobacter geochelonis]CZE46649.1 formate hydrogenlyase complex iron-sulfur subunit [Campylobacter geochelonis]CZE49775.1 formate hydrogenlyase complex iron-sulfur subunit [Campylobacter geochelonis]
MMKLIDITEKYGRTTYKYPFEPYLVNENFRGKPSYIFNRCIGCAACGIACPSNAITVLLNDKQDKLIWQFDCGRCIFCGRCDEVCPTGAIHLSNEFELAIKFDKSALIQRGELEVVRCKCCDKPFTTHRLIEYSKERLSKANIPEKRIKEADEYLYICQKCKQDMSVDKLTKKEEVKIR